MNDGAIQSLEVKLQSVADIVSYGSDIVTWRLTHEVIYESQLLNIPILSYPLSSLALSTKLWTEGYYAILINYNKELSSRNLFSVAKVVFFSMTFNFSKQTQIIGDFTFKRHKQLQSCSQKCKLDIVECLYGKVGWRRNSVVE